MNSPSTSTAAPPLSPRTLPRSSRRPTKRFSSGLVYVAPAMLLIALVLIAPTIYGFYFSLYNIKFLRQTQFVGLDNYTYLLTDPDLLPVLVESLVFTIISVALTMTMALGIALWINRLTGLFALFVQILVIIPWVVSQVVGALLFRWVFVNDLGIGSYFLEQLGIHDFKPLSDPLAAMIVLVGYACWRSLGFAMVLLLAGLKGIPQDLYEAAHVDGASAWQSLMRITLPMLKTPVLITLVILTVTNLNNVEAPLIVTGGGPAGATDILPLDLYTRAFVQYDFNSAIALGIGVFAANILFALAYVRLVRQRG